MIFINIKRVWVNLDIIHVLYLIMNKKIFIIVMIIILLRLVKMIYKKLFKKQEYLFLKNNEYLIN